MRYLLPGSAEDVFCLHVDHFLRYLLQDCGHEPLHSQIDHCACELPNNRAGLWRYVRLADEVVELPSHTDISLFLTLRQSVKCLGERADRRPAVLDRGAHAAPHLGRWAWRVFAPTENIKTLAMRGGS